MNGENPVRDVSHPGYYAIIPADVRYDDRIPANAKLLYGEISALIGTEGFCYASNSYFMKIYGFSDPTITRLITKLESAGYIKRVLEKDQSGQVVRRRIYLSVSMPEIQPPINFDSTSHQGCGEGGIKNDGDTNLSNTVYKKENKKEKATPLSGDELGAVFVKWINTVALESWESEDKNLLYRCLAAFYKPRENKKQQPARSETAVNTLLNRLARLSGGDLFAMCEMLEQSTIAGWKSVFPLSGAAAARAQNKSSAKRRDEEWL